MSWYLKRLKPGIADRKKKHALDAKQVGIGTAEGNELVVNCSNHRVGKYHAVIFFKDNYPYLKDYGSLNGTFLKKREVSVLRMEKDQSHKLARGDIVSFGCMNTCDDGKGCFCYKVEKDELCYVNSTEDEAPNRSKLKENLLKGSEGRCATERCQYNVDVRKEIGELIRSNHSNSNFVEKQKYFKDNCDTSYEDESQCHISKDTRQVRHYVGKQKEKHENTINDERSSYSIDEKRRVEDSRHATVEKPKRAKGREEARADERRQCDLAKKVAQVCHNVGKQKHPRENQEGGQYHIDVTREIVQAQRNFVDIQKRAEEKEDLRRKAREDKLASEKLQREMMAKVTPGETIPRQRPGREFIKKGSSFCYFNADILEKPSSIKCVNVQDAIRFRQYLRNSLQDMSQDYVFDAIEKERAAKDSRKVLEYILSLTTVHEDELIVQCGTDLLLEFNGKWEITQRIITTILLNWGADIDQILPSSPRPPRTLNNNLETVPEENVISVLRVLSAQLKVQKSVCVPNKSEKWNEFLFGMLVLLSLDNKFTGCYSDVLNCLGALLDNIDNKSDPNWVYEYSKKLLELEADHYNLTSVVCHLLNGSSAAERLRVNTSFAAIQRIMGAPVDEINFQFNWRCREVILLVKSTTLMATLKPLDIYCLLIFMDVILRHPQIRDKPTQRFHEWLERLDPKIGINPHLNALISNYRVLWDVETGT